MSSMSRAINAGTVPPASVITSHAEASVHAAPGAQSIRRAGALLRLTYGIVPIVAGLDKFTNILANWQQYLNPLVTKILPVSGAAFMSAVGVIEVIAGCIVLARPRIGASIVAAWLTAIALNLIVSGHYLDVAVRDLVMAVGAFAAAEMSKTKGE